MICNFFDIQDSQRKVQALSIDDEEEKSQLKDPSAQSLYIKSREYIIDEVFKIGERFQQRKETIHIAVELIDQYYLVKSQNLPAFEFKAQFLEPKKMILHQATSIMIASKYDEIDDNITSIPDLINYFREWLAQSGIQKDFQKLVPNYE